MVATPSKQAIRSAKRQQRRNLSDSQQLNAAQSLANIISRQSFFLHSRHIAFYLANDGELNPDFLLQHAIASHKQVYLPALDPIGFNRLHFLRYRSQDSMVSNRFDIAEPRFSAAKLRPPWALDIIFLPLVAFDNSGHRLGMGGGFYDRTLARCCPQKGWGAKLVGLAHSFQEVDNLPTESWDIPLHAIATEQSLRVL